MPHEQGGIASSGAADGTGDREVAPGLPCIVNAGVGVKNGPTQVGVRPAAGKVLRSFLRGWAGRLHSLYARDFREAPARELDMTGCCGLYICVLRLSESHARPVGTFGRYGPAALL